MNSKNYQRKHLRAPFKETVLYADGDYVLKAKALNISGGGLLIDQLPSFPNSDEVSLLISLAHIPSMKNFSLIRMQTFSAELFQRRVIRFKAKMVRREQLAQSLENIFRSRFGLEFVEIASADLNYIEEYVAIFASNLVYLQTLIDSFNTDPETKLRTRTLASILGYNVTERISELRTQVERDYRNLQWL
jgi:hypothetical protein